MKIIPVLLLFFAVAVPIVHAETVLRIGSNISVDANQIVDGDYYVSVGPFSNTSMSGTVEGDMYALGGTVTTNGEIRKDLTIISGVSQLHATVTDDVRILSGEVTIAEHIGGDLFVIGGALKMLSSASVAGDVFFFGGNAEINGKVGGSVLGTSERMRIDAEVAGNVDVNAASGLTLGDKANIAGFVKYKSAENLMRAQNAMVVGEITHSTYTTTASSNTLKDVLTPLFITLFATLSLYLLFKKELENFVQRIVGHPVKSILFGFATLILGPIVSVLLMVTVLGALIGVIGFVFTTLSILVGYCLSGIVFGAYLSKIITKKVDISLFWVVVGTCVLYALMFIPMVGFPLMLCVLALSVGGVVYSAYQLLS